jgi:hypothetical protein
LGGWLLGSELLGHRASDWDLPKTYSQGSRTTSLFI